MKSLRNINTFYFSLFIKLTWSTVGTLQIYSIIKYMLLLLIINVTFRDQCNNVIIQAILNSIFVSA